MILDCCAQQRTYEKFFGLLAGVRHTRTHTHTLHLHNRVNSGALGKPASKSRLFSIFPS